MPLLFVPVPATELGIWLPPLPITTAGSRGSDKEQNAETEGLQVLHARATRLRSEARQAPRAQTGSSTR